MKDLLLLNLPFVSISRPAIGISTLKSVLHQHGRSCDIAYPNLRFAELVGLETYTVLDEKVSDALFAGDWLFAQYLFGEQLDLATFASTLKHHLELADYDRVMEARHQIGPFLQMCIDEYRIQEYRLIGFTTTFEQNLASLALARDSKRLFPDKLILFGGANCEGEMGWELHRSFPWIDFVFSGAAENSLPELLTALDKKQAYGGIKGLVYREGEQSISTGPAPIISDMNSVPIPDYDDYFDAVNRSPLKEQLHPCLPIETSRGCWWGAKSHCTFCGLNGSTMAFRSKTADRVLTELQNLKERHQIYRFIAVDNIIDMRYFQNVLPHLHARQLGVSLFYETKANLKKDQVRNLRDAGVLAIQPGIESLNTQVLKLMRKGVSALQNIQLLKWCQEYGVTVAWNLLYGFPGENPNDYQSMANYIDALYHLQPPHSMGVIRMDRFSPYFQSAATFGMVNVRPFTFYQYLYPLPKERLMNLAYFFEFDYADGRQPADYVGDISRQVEFWKNSQGCALYKIAASEPELILADTRPNRIHPHLGLNGWQREIYDYCDESRHRRSMLELMKNQYDVPAEFESWLDAFLAQMIEWKFMVREGDCYLSLAVPARNAA